MEKESAVAMIARCAAHSDGPQYSDLSAEQWAQVMPQAPREPHRPMASESLLPSDHGIAGAHRDLGDETEYDSARGSLSGAYGRHRPRPSVSVA